MESTIAAKYDLVIAVEPGLDERSIRLRVPSGHGEMLREGLREAVIEHSNGMEFSSGAGEIVHAVVSNETFWPSVAAVIHRFLGRNRGKRVQLTADNSTTVLDVADQSTEDALKVIETVLRKSRAGRKVKTAPRKQ